MAEGPAVDIGHWYIRKRIGEWMPALTKDNDTLKQFLRQHGM
jgi:hypothetical protein